jgi:hypothetical protein
VVDGRTLSDAEHRALTATRTLAAALLVAVLALAAMAYRLTPGTGDYRALVVPAALVGLVSPVIAYRLYSVLGAKMPPDIANGLRCEGFQRVTGIALSVTAGAALLGIVTYGMSSDPAAMTGVVTHVVLSGAIWPSRVRLESYLASGPPWGGA